MIVLAELSFYSCTMALPKACQALF
uniref:Uncharacterized protein n=1 Tax=Anguilla anguilla TaxID=7936 RepID=A0A0E9UBH5_ANGAN